MTEVAQSFSEWATHVIRLYEGKDYAPKFSKGQRVEAKWGGAKGDAAES